jgi:hypothetical protein
VGNKKYEDKVYEWEQEVRGQGVQVGSKKYEDKVYVLPKHLDKKWRRCISRSWARADEADGRLGCLHTI